MSLSAEFESLFVSEFGFVCRMLQRLGVREADVNDVAQELFLAVHRGLEAWDRSRPPRPWLMGFAVRFASNYRRLAWHRGRELDEEMLPPSPRLNDRISAKRTVMRGLDALDFDKRVALVMHDLEELTAKEISEQLGIPANTVSSRVRLAREAFRAAVKKVEPDSERQVAP
jgi:RNA polymerase sigma-70 factor, ECF subfamily